MPGWDILQQPFQYHRPESPIVPEPDNTAAKIISAGTSTAVNAFLQAAALRQRAELEQEQLTQQAALAIRGQDIARENNKMDYEVGLRGQDIQRDNVNLDYYIKNKNLEIEQSLLPHKVEALDALTEQRGAQAKRSAALISKTAGMIEEAGKDAEGLGLYDPKFQKEHPMQYAKNAYGFQQMWEGTSEPKLKATIKMFINKAEASKVRLPDAQGQYQQYSWAQIARDIDEKGFDSPFADALKKAGYFTKEQSGNTTTRNPKPELQRILEDSKAAKFSELPNIKSKIPNFGKGNLPAPEGSPIETEVNFVKQKIASDPSNADFYKQKFLERNPGSEALLEE